jgi:hypothetical protein
MTVTALAVAIAAAKVLDGGNVNSGSAPSNFPRPVIDYAQFDPVSGGPGGQQRRCRRRRVPIAITFYQPSAAIASDDGTTGAIAFLFAVAGVNLSNADSGD